MEHLHTHIRRIVKSIKSRRQILVRPTREETVAQTLTIANRIERPLVVNKEFMFLDLLDAVPPQALRSKEEKGQGNG